MSGAQSTIKGSLIHLQIVDHLIQNNESSLLIRYLTEFLCINMHLCIYFLAVDFISKFLRFKDVLLFFNHKFPVGLSAILSNLIRLGTEMQSLLAIIKVSGCQNTSIEVFDRELPTRSQL